MVGVLTSLKAEKNGFKVKGTGELEAQDSKSVSKKDDRRGETICLRTTHSE